MTTSAVPVVIDRILQRLTDDEHFAEAEIIDGIGREDEGRTVIAIGDVDPGSWDRDWAGMPARQIDEKFAINFWIRVRETGLDQKDARDKVFELLAYMDVLVVDQVTFRNEIDEVLTIALKPGGFYELPTDEGMTAYLAGVIACTTRIQPKANA